MTRLCHSIKSNFSSFNAKFAINHILTFISLWTIIEHIFSRTKVLLFMCKHCFFLKGMQNKFPDKIWKDDIWERKQLRGQNAKNNYLDFSSVQIFFYFKVWMIDILIRNVSTVAGVQIKLQQKFFFNKLLSIDILRYSFHYKNIEHWRFLLVRWEPDISFILKEGA